MKVAINEVFYSLQGEGVRTGTPNVFVRFRGCNLRCDLEPSPKSPGGFKCDTEFESGRVIDLNELDAWIDREAGCDWSQNGRWLILTGGEPALQANQAFCDAMHQLDYLLAIETNGTMVVSRDDFDWITCSPKVAEHALVAEWANEVKYVRGYGQGVPEPRMQAEHYLISPAFDGGIVRPDVLDWCIKLCLANPPWRLSLQSHKLWCVR